MSTKSYNIGQSAEKEIRYKANQKERDMKRVSLWVHRNDETTLKEFAKELRDMRKIGKELAFIKS